jgi:hypothetical protein
MRGGEWGWVRWRPGEASAFYRGRREAEAAGKGEATVINGAFHCCRYRE